jgi:hypothetical protein
MTTTTLCQNQWWSAHAETCIDGDMECHASQKKSTSIVQRVLWDEAPHDAHMQTGSHSFLTACNVDE